MRIAVWLTTLTVLAACGEKPPLLAEAIEITEPIPGRHMSAGFMTLTNNTDDALRITRVYSPDYASVEVHESTIENGVARMREIETLTIPPNSHVVLERGGLHLMLMGATGNPDTVALRFFDDQTPLLEVAAEVHKRER